MNLWLASLLFYFVTPMVQASVCCGGHAAIPSLVTGFERSRLNASVAQSTIIGDAPVEGLPVFREDREQTTRKTWRFSAATRLTPRWQIGAGIPISFYSQLGDSDAMAAYEFYHRDDPFGLAPMGLQFVQLTMPTGHSVYSLDQPGEDHITGSGFYKTAVGQLWLSTWHKWDFFLMPKISYGWTRTFHQRLGDLTVTPGWTTDALLGTGWAVSPFWRVGGSLQYTSQNPWRIQDTLGSRTSAAQLVWPVSFQVSYFYDLQSTISFVYEDETLIGPVQNTTLSRTASLQYSYRWGE